jgi:hypothetical protein
LLEAEKQMSAAKQIANRWYGKLAGVALIALGIAVTSLPAPTGALHSLEDSAVYGLAPLMNQSDIGREILAVYVARDTECHREMAASRI